MLLEEDWKLRVLENGANTTGWKDQFVALGETTLERASSIEMIVAQSQIAFKERYEYARHTLRGI